MKRLGMFLKAKSHLLLLLVAVVFYGQNAHAIAIAESTAYFNWGSLKVGGVLIGANTDLDFTISNKTLRTTMQSGYTTPNNGSDISPIKKWYDWGIHSEKNGVAAYTYFDVNNNVITTGTNPPPSWFRRNPAGGSGGSYSSAVDNNIHADVSAVDGYETHGDILGTTQYSGSARTTRGGAFQYTGTTGDVEFTIDYLLWQHLLVDSQYDIASVTTSFDFFVGTGTTFDVNKILSGNTPTPNLPVSMGYIAPWASSNIFYDRNIDGTTFNYEENATQADTKTVFDDQLNGTLTFLVHLVENQTYYFRADVNNDAFAASTLQAPQIIVPLENPSAETPEPCTVALFGVGMSALAFARKRFSVLKS